MAQLEARLQAANMSAAAAGMSPNDPTLHPARPAQLTGPTGPSASQQAIATQPGNALQTEYGLYVTAAKNPAQQQALLSAAQNASPDARSAVIYNLQMVETQLAQEAAIQAAEQSAISGTGTAPTTLRAPEVGPITQGSGPPASAWSQPSRSTGSPTGISTPAWTSPASWTRPSRPPLPRW